MTVDDQNERERILRLKQNAAPELYQALKALVALDDGEESGLWKFEEEFNNARAAIAKAEKP